MKKPNILFVMTDQQRADALGCAGGWTETPNFDRIASEGVRYANAITNSPVCVPARVSLATGLHPHSTGVWNNLPYVLPPECKTWMQVIRDCGYRTSLFGKTHLHPHHGDLREKEDLMHAYGLDDVDEIGGPRASARLLSHMTARWQEKGLWEDYQEDYRERFSNKAHVVRPSTLPLEEYADTYVGQRCKEYLTSYARSEPWFCWVSFGGPHEPWDTPEPYASQHSPENMPAPTPRPEWSSNRPTGALDTMLARGSSIAPEDPPALRADYAGKVALIDTQIGEILKAIEARGELDNTVIAFSSDHGELNGDHGFIYKECFLDGCLRVPLIVRTPATMSSDAAGKVCQSPAELMDVGPTLVELAGGTIEHEQYGKSLAPTLSNPEGEHRTEAISEISGEIMLLDQEWKCAINAEGQVYLLFDVQNDPQEQNNLAGQSSMKEIEETLRLRILERVVQNQRHAGRL